MPRDEHWVRHHWLSRRVTVRMAADPPMYAVCCCPWWKRLLWLAIGRSEPPTMRAETVSDSVRKCEACGWTRFTVDYIPAHMAGFLWRTPVPARVRVTCTACGREFYAEPGSLVMKQAEPK